MDRYVSNEDGEMHQIGQAQDIQGRPIWLMEKVPRYDNIIEETNRWVI